VSFQWRPDLRDEADNKFTDAAVEAAAIIVTYSAADFRDSDIPRFGWAAMTPQESLARYLAEEEC